MKAEIIAKADKMVDPPTQVKPRWVHTDEVGVSVKGGSASAASDTKDEGHIEIVAKQSRFPSRLNRNDWVDSELTLRLRPSEVVEIFAKAIQGGLIEVAEVTVRPRP